MAILGKIAELFGKEITEEMAKEFQDELDDFKSLIKANRGLEDMPNLEIETHSFNVPHISNVVELGVKTKIEHKKVVGVVLTKSTSHKGDIFLSINRQPIVSDDFFPSSLITRHTTLSVYESAWRLDFPIENSDLNIKYKNTESSFVPYDVYVHLICLK